MNGVRHLDLTPDQLAEAQRRFTAIEQARQAYQDWLDATLAAAGIDHAGRDVRFNPWTGRFTVPLGPEPAASKAG